MERFLLVHVPGPLLGALMVVVAVAISVGGLMLVRRNVALATLEQHNDVAGFIIAVIGLLYGVLLAFVVIIVWQQYDAATSNANHEAISVDLLYRDAALFPDQTAPIRQTLREYAHSVVDDEWHAMSDRQGDSPVTDHLVGQLLTQFRAVHIQSPEEQTFYTESVKRVYDLADARRQRLDANSNQLPGVLWIVLLAGGVITVGFTYFFGVSHFASHVLMVAALAAMIALTLYLVLSLDLPFSGDLRVGPHAMEQAIRELAHL
ncbi:MAG: hypothetical protein QOJ52_3418 [Acidimicrobiaceae bacterium]|nr:hypothetical protein [Acidimicrobiaceae bacterium]MDQ1421456.1 hypothetical protein [Acidimicrobiaceae bacterium]